MTTDELHIALISGGRDSAVAAHKAMTDGPCELLLYLDTGTGLSANREYIESYADHFGWYLMTIRTQENYEELVKKYGFPGPSKHLWFYQYLKERQIGKLATIAGDRELHCWTGVHKGESENRMKRVTETQEDGSGRWMWHAPCADWSQQRFDEYFAEHDIPENDLWSTLGRSGDCFCGAFGNREELLDVDAIDGDVADKIRQIEEELDIEKAGFDDPERLKWAWHDDDPSAWAMDDDKQMMLCANCGYNAGEERVGEWSDEQ